MRIGIPQCGHAYIIAEALVQKLDNGENELIVPRPTSHRTLDLGVKYSPVEACLPFKLTLGNLIEACELGADTLIPWHWVASSERIVTPGRPGLRETQPPEPPEELTHGGRGPSVDPCLMTSTAKISPTESLS